MSKLGKKVFHYLYIIFLYFLDMCFLSFYYYLILFYNIENLFRERSINAILLSAKLD